MTTSGNAVSPSEIIFCFESNYSSPVLTDENVRAAECNRFIEELNSALRQTCSYQHIESKPWKVTYFLDGFFAELPVLIAPDDVESFRLAIRKAVERSGVRAKRTYILAAKT